MNERSDPPPRLKDLLGSVVARAGLDDPVSTGAVWAHWDEMVGADVARNAEPTSLKSGVLRIRTESPVWATEIGYLGPEIKRRVNAALGRELVTEVVVWTGPGPIRSSGKTAGDRGGRAQTPAQSPREIGPKDPVSAFENARRAWAKRRSGRAP